MGWKLGLYVVNSGNDEFGVIDQRDPTNLTRNLPERISTRLPKNEL